MIYSWQSFYLEANPLHTSARFLISIAIGKIVGPYVFTWLTHSNAQGSSQQIVATLYNSISAFMIVGYVLFLFLSASVHKAKRQMQIIQLSGAINGKSFFVVFWR